LVVVDQSSEVFKSKSGRKLGIKKVERGDAQYLISEGEERMRGDREITKMLQDKKEGCNLKKSEKELGRVNWPQVCGSGQGDNMTRKQKEEALLHLNNTKKWREGDKKRLKQRRGKQNAVNKLS